MFVVRPSRPHIVDGSGIVRAKRPHHKIRMTERRCGEFGLTKHIQRLVEASDFGRRCPDELSVGRQNLWLIADHFDTSCGEGFDLGILDVFSLEHRREEPQQPASGDFSEQCDVEEPVVDLRLGRHQKVGGKAAVGDLEKGRLSFDDIAVELQLEPEGAEKRCPVDDSEGVGGIPQELELCGRRGDVGNETEPEDIEVVEIAIPGAAMTDVDLAGGTAGDEFEGLANLTSLEPEITGKGVPGAHR